jgi:hypothetical protein
MMQIAASNNIKNAPIESHQSYRQSNFAMTTLLTLAIKSSTKTTQRRYHPKIKKVSSDP